MAILLRKFLPKVIVLSLLGLLGLTLVEPAAARQLGLLAPPEIPGEAVYVPFPVSIKLDGKLDDWKEVPVQVVTKGSAPSTIPGENSPLSFSVAADAEHFYLTMSIVDKNIITGQHDTSFWNEDSLEFYLNTSGDLNAAAFGEGIVQININPGDIGNTDPAKLTLSGQNFEQAQVSGFVFKTADGWGFEVALPLKLKPAHGLEIGFQAQSNGASQRDRDVKLIWSNADTADTSWQSPYLFGRALFFEVGQTDIPTPAPRAAAPTAAPTATPVALPKQISVNQVGYYANSSKIAVLVSESQTPVEWTLKDASGQTALTGKTQAKGPDVASGDSVHWIDFSDYATPGKGYTLAADGQTSDPFEIGAALYGALKLDALRYFYLNRSGTALEQQYAGEWARPAGHISDNQVTCYAGADASGKNWPACDYKLNASGGWYDAGDYGKYVVNGGIAVWTLLNAYERNPDAFADKALNIPESGNGLPDILDETRWEMEFLLGMQVPVGQPLAGMAHHKLHGLQWDGMPVLPPTQSASRFLFPPSTAATLNLAATAAQCARIWKSIDADFAARCLAAAETAWQAANANPAMLAADFPTLGGGGYGDNNVSDEFYWAAVELSLTTGKAEYQKYYTGSGSNLSTQSMYWGGAAPLGTISLAVVGKDEAARAAVVKSADGSLSAMSADGYLSPVPATNYVWGSNSDVLNRAIMLALAYDFTGEARYLNGVTENMNYLLGRNSLNFSFISGYGARALSHPHHRFWANQSPDYPPPPPGAVAGGPNGFTDDPTARAAGLGLPGQPHAKSYIDQIGSYSTNEVAINWNAPLAWVAAYLDDTARPLLSDQQPAEAPTATPTVIPATAPAAPDAQPQPVPWGAVVGGVIVLGLIVAAVILVRRRKP